MDPLAVHLAMAEAAEHMRSGGGPAVVEAEVYRFFHQNGPYPGSAFGYRTKDEEAAWRERDPLDRVAREMTKLGLIDAERVAALRSEEHTSALQSLILLSYAFFCLNITTFFFIFFLSFFFFFYFFF